eukprot:CAMPEP_0184096706 /NCGR_PEP_ID=MMETSP0974-20121125/10425_1 /TAXON_ID=483370 /ORGANISM="non described non described, Strain CCMP2097" /LENGTH=68 /DNA_ID=CAMNT_0026399551 /DNA_START=75 /DNA_END=281 /DNA_ORIENTATION=+
MMRRRGRTGTACSISQRVRANQAPNAIGKRQSFEGAIAELCGASSVPPTHAADVGPAPPPRGQLVAAS